MPVLLPRSRSHQHVHRAGARTAAMTDHAVVIAGAGPTGLMLAAELALANVDVVVVERRANQELVETRAGGLHARTLEILDQRGVADRRRWRHSIAAPGWSSRIAKRAILSCVRAARSTQDLAVSNRSYRLSFGLWQPCCAQCVCCDQVETSRH